MSDSEKIFKVLDKLYVDAETEDRVRGKFSYINGTLTLAIPLEKSFIEDTTLKELAEITETSTHISYWIDGHELIIRFWGQHIIRDDKDGL